MNYPSDLDVAFLSKILGKLRDVPLHDFASSGTFYEFVPGAHKADRRKTSSYVQEHLEYLRDIGLLELGAETIDGSYGLVKLTAQGRSFVQPELAEFYGAVTAQLVSAVEAQIATSSLPDDEKHTLTFKLREAIATHGVDVAVKFIVEILTKLATGV